jgi:hypothetical protein
MIPTLISSPLPCLKGLALDRPSDLRLPVAHQGQRQLFLRPVFDLREAAEGEQMTTHFLRDDHGQPCAALTAEALGPAGWESVR